MATASTQAPATLRITRTFAAPRERVFHAWTDPRALARWFAPTVEFRTTVLEHEARVGGRYRIEMRIGDRPHVHWGVFRELSPPAKLSFTWVWDNRAVGGDAGESLVTIELYERGGGGSTELVLTQEGFPSEKSRSQHDEGWTGCLNRLETFLSERSIA